MSEERRKRQESRQADQTSPPKRNKIILYVIVAALLAGAFLAGRYYKAAGVKLFPSWQFGSDPPKEGVLSLQALSDKTGCSLP
jgi:hypothetical protein